MPSGTGMYWRSHRSALTPRALAPKRRMSSPWRRENFGIRSGRWWPLPGRDTALDLLHPALAVVLALDRTGSESRLHVEDAARDVVAGAALDDGVLRHDHAADGHAVPGVRVGHQVRADDALVARAVGDLLPHLLLGRLIESLGEEGVRLHLHAPDLREHVVVLGYLLRCVLERHRHPHLPSDTSRPSWPAHTTRMPCSSREAALLNRPRALNDVRGVATFVIGKSGLHNLDPRPRSYDWRSTEPRSARNEASVSHSVALPCRSLKVSTGPSARSEDRDRIPSRTRPRALVSRDIPRIRCVFRPALRKTNASIMEDPALNSREPSLSEAGDRDLARRHGKPGCPGSDSSTPGVPMFMERKTNLLSEGISSFQSRPRCFQAGHREYVIRGPKGSSPVIEGIKPGHCACEVRSARGPGPGFASKRGPRKRRHLRCVARPARR